MYNLLTNKIANTRDAKWTNNLYEHGMQGDKGQSDYYMASEEEYPDPESEKEEQEQPRRSRRIQSENDTDEKVLRALKKMNFLYYDPMMSAMAFVDYLAMVGGTAESYDYPDQFQDAWNLPDEKEREYWRSAIKKEFNDMIKWRVWRQTRTTKIPENRRLIGSK